MTNRGKKWGWAAGLAMLGGGALALTPSMGGVVHACVGPNGFTRIVNASTACGPQEMRVTWNQAGPQGPSGPQGPEGAPGLDGTSAPIPRSTVVGRATFEFSTGAKQSEVRSFSMDFATPPGEPTIRFSKPIDASSGRLDAAFLSGVPISQVEIAIQPPGEGSPLVTYRLTKVHVKAISQLDSGADGEVALESVSLVPGQFELITGR